MVQTLDIISVNIWQILISLINLLIMYLILKKFLFGPVQKIIATRKQQVEDIYTEAQEKRDSAETMRHQYEEKLATARDEADGIVRTAQQTAQRRSDAIVAEASKSNYNMLMDSVYWIEQFAYRHIAVKCINYICNVFAHIYLNVPLLGKQLGGTVNQVGGKDAVKYAFLCGLVKLIKALGKQTEGSKYEYTARALFLELVSKIKNGFTA